MNSSCRCASASASLACSLALSRSRTGTNASKWACLDFLLLVKIRPGWWKAVTNSKLHHFAENPWPDHLQPIPVQHVAPPASARVSICVKTAQNAWETPYKCTAKYCKCGRPKLYTKLMTCMAFLKGYNAFDRFWNPSSFKSPASGSTDCSFNGGSMEGQKLGGAGSIAAPAGGMDVKSNRIIPNNMLTKTDFKR